jgi:hypothetical protein
LNAKKKQQIFKEFNGRNIILFCAN